MKIGDKVNYKGYEWFVTKIEDEKVTLMMANRMSDEDIEELFYEEEMRDSNNDVKFDKKTNDWKDSYIRKVLNKRFINKLEKQDLNEMTINYAEDEYTTDYVRIPSLKECRELPKEILTNNKNVFWVINRGCCRKDIYNWSSVGAFAFYYSGGNALTNYSFRAVLAVICVNKSALEPKITYMTIKEIEEKLNIENLVIKGE